MAQIQVFDLLAPIMQICRGCNTTTATEAYIHAVRDLCRRSKIYKSSLAGVTVSAQSLYSLGSDTYSEIIGVRAVSVTVTADTDIRSLRPFASGLWDLTRTDTVPEVFQYVTEAQLAVHPAPDAVYTLSISLILQPKRGSNGIDDSLVTKWESAFRDGALAYLLRLPGMAWTDKDEANRKEESFDVWVRRAKVEAELAYANHEWGAEIDDPVFP